ncbi:acyl-CoA thioesterase [Allopontixanthobacter sediminis]|uniref:Thioesterase family protein n=1 Tax=Allopontixanthobacter sediminis TaxID=1689985 RepID=A0A845AX21_9SPHN|nr:thioesterase family protein [Allopontixanthobacter sediminis]MXP44063.1 thioesterase family protein [Allopontixanthobacter sediminis]
MSIRNLLDPITADGGPVELPAAEGWMQGRTVYGGSSALIAYVAALRKFPDLPPLRAAQIGFVAPVGTEMELRAEVIREGRNVTQVRSEILCEGRIALTAMWLFGAGRAPNGEHASPPLDVSVGAPEEGAPVDDRMAPAFLKNHYEVRHTAEQVEPGIPVVRRWVRLSDRSGLDPVEEVILMGDTLPPSAIRIMERPGPLSSINWSFNLIEPSPATRDGWWLAETASDHANLGYSSERLRLWNSDGRQITSGLQSVAIFG